MMNGNGQQPQPDRKLPLHSMAAPKCLSRSM